MSGTLPSSAGGPASRRRQPTELRRGEKIGLALLAASIAGSALAFGGQHPPVLVVVSVAAALSALLLRASAVPRATYLLIALGLYTSLQLVPLPLSWVEALSPASGAVWRGSLSPFGVPPSRWATLSIDPAHTALEVLKWFGYACVLVAASVVRARRSAALVAMLVFFSAASVCVITLAHGVLDTSRIYGYFRTPEPSQWLRGPLINGNNLAGYLNLGVFTGVGLWSMRDTRFPKWPFALAIPLMTAQILLSGSRGGIGMLLIGALTLAFFTLRQRRVISRRLTVSVGASLGAGLAAALALGGSRLVTTVGDTETQAKISAWRWSLDMIGDFPIFGVGRGAFEAGFQPYRKLLGRDWTMVFAHAENVVLEWTADWGIPVAVAAIVGWILLALRPFSRAFRDPLASGLATGLVALVIQNFVDTGLELFALMSAALTAFAALADPVTLRGSRFHRAALFAAVATLLATVVVVTLGATPLQLERRRLAQTYAEWTRNGSREPRAFLAALRPSMELHPGEAYFPLIGSIAAGKAGADPMPWLARALERSPLDGQAHYLLGEVLLSRGHRRQALLHYRLAAHYDVILRDAVLTRAAGAMRSSSDLLSAFPKDLPGGNLLAEVCGKAIGPIRVTCWREVLARDPKSVPAKRELAAALLDALETGLPACSGEHVAGCQTDVEDLLGELEKSPRDWRIHELRARERASRGELKQATTILLDHCPATEDAIPCSERAMVLSRRANDLASLGAAADRYATVACNEPRRCARAHEHVAQLYSELSAWGLAFRHLSSAANAEPTADRWINSGEAASRAGSNVGARLAFERARRTGELNVAQRGRIDSIERALVTR